MTGWWFMGLVSGILFTPGPTNTLLATAGMQQGWRGAVRLIPCELAGYVIAISGWGFGMAAIMAWFPAFPSVMKTLSALYLWYLAYQLWQRNQPSSAAMAGRISAKTLFVATLLNPKALLFATAVFPVASWHLLTEYAVTMSEFAVVVMVAAGCWIALGASLREPKRQWLQPQQVQRVAACVLGVFAIPVLVSAWWL